jgi:hypothetical protein
MKKNFVHAAVIFTVLATGVAVYAQMGPLRMVWHPAAAATGGFRELSAVARSGRPYPRRRIDAEAMMEMPINYAWERPKAVRSNPPVSVRLSVMPDLSSLEVGANAGD